MAGSAPVLVACAGALGSVVGGLLARAGWPVTLLGRRLHLDAVGSRGLLVEGLFGTHRVTGLSCAVSPEGLRGPYETVFLAVKAYDSEEVAALVAPHLAPDGFLVSLQNGLGNLEAAARAVGSARVLGARVIFGAEVAEPGRVRVTVYADPVLIGSPDPADHRRREAAISWAANLTAAGIPCEPSEAIVADLWAKLLYSAALNPVGALLGLSYGALADDIDTRAIMDAVIDEAFAVAAAEGVTLRWAAAQDYREEFYHRLVPATAAHRSSMLQDIERGRPTEIEAINGWVAARAAAHGLPAPVNATLTRLLRARARPPGMEARWNR
ncbi:MAG TPA: 2-dehydropantoate 2-reductase [Candidatus Binatus sp.]|jgi:2-dehydropantoate 2-reductase|nr:2-dehydropantoate 2-reductase [Candidatus Binatus sp.]